MHKLISQGAEAKIFLHDSAVQKLRSPKSYRIKEIDDALRGSRTRREAKILEKLGAIGFPIPRLLSSDDEEKLIIEHIPGKLMKDILDEGNSQKLGREIGKKIATLHNSGIIHGDLTTSNMILHEKKKEIFFIDFGLSFFSLKDEDKEVDLHVLKEALESKHHTIWKPCFESALHEYAEFAKGSKKILERLEAVEKRGRYRAKKGS